MYLTQRSNATCWPSPQPNSTTDSMPCSRINWLITSALNSA